MAQVIDVTDETFASVVLSSKIPVVVDFWAEWCNPCRLMAPVVKELAAEMDGKVLFAKLDVDANHATPGAYGIQGIPTLIFFVGGKPVGQQVGAMSKDALKSALAGALGVS
ncbi:MAG: thioredoxin [Candidatus Eisenbacteria bacterium]|nr:thioredoxin [Candidatus Eisenbacteria bacterium]